MGGGGAACSFDLNVVVASLFGTLEVLELQVEQQAPESDGVTNSQREPRSGGETALQATPEEATSWLNFARKGGYAPFSCQES